MGHRAQPAGGDPAFRLASGTTAMKVMFHRAARQLAIRTSSQGRTPNTRKRRAYQPGTDILGWPSINGAHASMNQAISMDTPAVFSPQSFYPNQRRSCCCHRSQGQTWYKCSLLGMHAQKRAPTRLAPRQARARRQHYFYLRQSKLAEWAGANSLQLWLGRSPLFWGLHPS